MPVGLELVVDELYSFKELEDNGIELLRFYSHWSLFTDGNKGYIFRHMPFRQLKIRFRYEREIKLPGSSVEDDTYTEFEKEQYEEDLKNCCHPLRFDASYKPPDARI